MAEPLTLMAVHAHPDDEASGGGILAATPTRASGRSWSPAPTASTATRPAGSSPGRPGHDPEAVARQRLAELDESAKILKVSDLETLGYHDSGMEEWDYKSRPDAFCNVPLDDGGRAGSAS